ncbi:hypothetical protein HUA74_34890 [Myxococcus sp. CA051A]|uniref:hypothetical protein n=1 Tax=Myxococcus sp. CA051A TaxID=2741739 RepID=UPI00157AE0FC|nr:hypothetical protein [Myxococcus sp. CA051A]NTX65859.1 hypothetical protein [Myxococcus sp. CA051A]
MTLQWKRGSGRLTWVGVVVVMAVANCCQWDSTAGSRSGALKTWSEMGVLGSG